MQIFRISVGHPQHQKLSNKCGMLQAEEHKDESGWFGGQEELQNCEENMYYMVLLLSLGLLPMVISPSFFFIFFFE